MRNPKFDNNFCVYILSHKRADNINTLKTLRKQGYTGKIYIIIDNEDPELDKYLRIYGKENIKIFNKQEAINITDSMDNFQKRDCVVYARNYLFKIAREMDIKYFLVLDDDYNRFTYTFDSNGRYITRQNLIQNMDEIISIYLEFYKNTPQLISLAFAQSGDFMGGVLGNVPFRFVNNEIPRKVMNAFFCSVDRPFKFYGSINEDTTAYAWLGSQGKLFITLPVVRLCQKLTQIQKGSLTDVYLELGTYVKSFYTLMTLPQVVKITEMGVKYTRLHHSLHWNNIIPCIVPEEYKRK